MPPRVGVSETVGLAEKRNAIPERLKGIAEVRSQLGNHVARHGTREWLYRSSRRVPCRIKAEQHNGNPADVGLSADAALQVTDLVTHRRPRNVEPFGCSAKVQVFGYGYKIA
jgi:hypothetical protein